MRLVLDTNTVVSALLWHGPPHQLVRAARTHALAFFTSPVLLAELEGVLARGKFAHLIPTGQTSTQLMRRYQELATVIQPHPITPVARDPDDDHVLACALAARAELIVSGDRDLLTLGEFHSIRIVSANTALAITEGSRS